MNAPIRIDGTPQWFVRTLDALVPLPLAADALRADHPYLIWLDSARAQTSRPDPRVLSVGATGRYSVLGWDPWLLASCRDGEAVIQTGHSTVRRSQHPLEFLRGLLVSYRASAAPGVPVGPGLMGYLSYELNGWIERLPPPQAAATARVPELWFAGMRQMIVADHQEQRSWLISVADPHQPPHRAAREACQRLEALEAFLSALEPTRRAASCIQRAVAVEPLMSQPEFEAMVRQAQASIAAGDIFQANLSQAFQAPWCGSAWSLYLALRAINPSPFACFLQSPDVTVVSCSPERLVRAGDGEASTRPIAGTRPRGRTAAEDALNSLELLLSDKERAEHIMLVDLERNDLGRICRPGSVAVDELMAVEDYSHVLHIVSNARGRLRPGVDAVDVIRAMFPGGTITGCPKIRCMQLVRALEPLRRGLYTGSCGWLGFDGRLDLNILIRTMVLQDGRVSFHAGAGIVADSQPDREYHETLAKAAALHAALHAAGRSHDAPIC